MVRQFGPLNSVDVRHWLTRSTAPTCWPCKASSDASGNKCVFCPLHRQFIHDSSNPESVLGSINAQWLHSSRLWAKSAHLEACGSRATTTTPNLISDLFHHSLKIHLQMSSQSNPSIVISSLPRCLDPSRDDLWSAQAKRYWRQVSASEQPSAPVVSDHLLR